MKKDLNEVAYLSSEIGYITTNATWTEPEIMILLYISGDVGEIQEVFDEDNNKIFEYTFNKKTLNKLLGRRLSTKEFDKVFERLITRNVFFRDDEDQSNTRYTIFNEIKWYDADDTFIKLKLTNKAYSRIKKLSPYIPFAIKHRLYLKHANHIRMYVLILKDLYYYNTYSKFKFFNILELRDLFGCIDKYLKSSDFINKVIIKSINMINKHSDLGHLDLKIEYSLVNESNNSKFSKIKGVNLKGIKKESYINYALPSKLKKFTDQIHEEIDSSLNDIDVKYLESIEISHKMIKSLVNKYSVGSIKNAIIITREKAKEGFVKSASAYFMGTVAKGSVIDSDKFKQKELMNKMEMVEKFCSSNNDSLVSLFDEKDIFLSYLINFRLNDFFLEFKNLIGSIVQLGQDIDFDFKKSMNLLFSYRNKYIYIRHLIELSEVECISSSYEEAIELYNKEILEFKKLCISGLEDSEVNFNRVKGFILNEISNHHDVCLVS